ncbi:MAG: hypothetical protein LBV79_11610 [Candidatus Adiutrix sp.]|jgi:hypothetical protein|nr:hypothetical protein [Candidatus Adiutrix sp.]
MNRAKTITLSLCLTMLLLAFSVAAQAADVKLGKYASTEIMNGEFHWHFILKADKTVDFQSMDFEGIYDWTGAWKADNSGKVTITLKSGNTKTPIIFTGGGGNTLTMVSWPFGMTVENMPFHYDPNYK